MAKKSYRVYDPGALDKYKKKPSTQIVKKRIDIVPRPIEQAKAKSRTEIKSKALADVRKKYRGMSDEKLKLEAKLLTYNKIVNKMKFDDLVNVIKIIIRS